MYKRQGLLPLLAYHYAAGQQEKRRAAFRLWAGISLLFALVCLVLFEGCAPQLAISISGWLSAIINM